MLSDDPYADVGPVPYLGRQLHVPNLAVGRLVETPTEISDQVHAFALSTNGRLNPRTALTTGYDFLKDAGASVNSFLGQYVPAAANQSVISDTWTRSTLVGPAGMFLPTGGSVPEITSLNGHADFYGFQPAVLQTDPAQPAEDPRAAGFVTTEDILASALTFGGRIVFSMGCHAGLNVPDAFLPPGRRANDWAEAFAHKNAAAFVGNTGFGFGDTDLLAYGEELNRLFAKHMVSGRYTLGQALSQAKQDYIGSLQPVGVYDEKTSAELTLYGLPMWKIGTTDVAQPAAPPVTTIVDPIVGLTAQSIDTNPTFTPTIAGNSRGTYYTGGDGVQVTHFRPIQPKEVEEVGVPNAHGALITELVSATPLVDFNPVFARPVVDNSVSELEIPFNDVVFPAQLQVVTHQDVPGTALSTSKLVLVTGQFTGRSAVDDAGLGTEDLFTHFKTLVYSTGTQAREYEPPVFSQVDALAVDTTGGQPLSAQFKVKVADAGGVKRVLVGYQDGAAPAWKFVDLVQGQDGTWTGQGARASAAFRYFAQAVDSSGNVAVTTNKGSYYAQRDTITTPGTGAGPTSITIATPTATTYAYGESVIASYACTDPDSVVTSCTATLNGIPVNSGDPLPTTTQGANVFTVTAVAGGVTKTSSVTFTLSPPVTTQPCVGPAPPGAIVGGSGNDTINGTPGNDVIYGMGGNDRINGKGGSDTICTLSGTDTITTGEGNDTVVDTGGTNTVATGGGTDQVTTGSGTDTINSGEGDDVVTDAGGTNSIATGGGVDRVTTGSGTDAINSGEGDDVVTDAGGTNNITTGGGDDRVTTGSGTDTIDSGEGSDVVTDAGGTNSITTGGGDDRVTTGSGTDTINTGEGNDTVTDTGGTNAVNVAGGIDNVTTGSGNDTITGGGQDDTINAGDGDNTVNGNDGNDRITTGSGNDKIDGGAGTDTCRPGPGNNSVTNCEIVVSVTPGGGNDVIEGGSQNDTINAGNGNNKVNGRPATTGSRPAPATTRSTAALATTSALRAPATTTSRTAKADAGGRS